GAGTAGMYGVVYGGRYVLVKKAPASYTLIEHDGLKVGGMFRQARPAGAPVGSRWLGLLSVADPAKATDQVRQRGGKVLVAPVTVAGRGTHAGFRDPQGAGFGVLAASDGDPPDDPVTDGEVFWVDLFTPEPSQAEAFYGALANYEISESEIDTGHKRRILASEGIARAGIVALPDAKVGPGWMP